MNYLEVFGVLTGVAVDVSKFCGDGAGVLKARSRSLKNAAPFISGAQPLRYCRPHYVYFYELRPPVSSTYFWLFALRLSAYTEPSLLSNVGLVVFSAKHPHTVAA